MALALVAAMLPLPGSLALAAGPGPAANDARTQVVDGVRLDAAHQPQASHTDAKALAKAEARAAHTPASADRSRGDRMPAVPKTGRRTVAATGSASGSTAGTKTAQTAADLASVTPSFSSLTFYTNSPYGNDAQGVTTAVSGAWTLSGSGLYVEARTKSTHVPQYSWIGYDFFALPGDEYYWGSFVGYSIARDRFVAAMPSSQDEALGCGNGYLNVAVSTTNDPSKPWSRFRIAIPDGFADGVQIGFSDDKVVLTTNEWDLDAASPYCLGSTWEGSRIRVVDWADLQDAGTLTVRDVSPAPRTDYYAWIGAQVVPGTASTVSGNTLYLAGDKFANGVWGNLAYATVTGGAKAGTLVVGNVDLTTTGVSDPLLGPTAAMAAFNSGNGHQNEKVLTAAWRAGRLWLSTNDQCTTDPDVVLRTCARFLKLDTTTSPPSVVHDVHFGYPERDTFLPLVGLSRDGTAFFSMSASSAIAHQPIDQYVSWQLADDGSPFPAEILMRHGTQAYAGQAWGLVGSIVPDTSGMDVAFQTFPTDAYLTPSTGMASRLRGNLSDDPSGSAAIRSNDGWVNANAYEADYFPEAASPILWIRESGDPTTEDTPGGPRLVHGVDGPASIWGAHRFDEPDFGATLGEGPHDIWFQWQTGDGHWSTPVFYTVNVDLTAPVTSVPVTSFAVGTTVGSTATMRTTWTGSDALSGMHHYQVNRTLSGGAGWSASPVTPSLLQALLLNKSYKYNVFGSDVAGNSSPAHSGPWVKPVAYQGSTALITYYKTWGTSTSSSYLGGSTRYATTLGAKATFTFTGRAVAFVSTKAKLRGSAEIYVDGVKVATISMYWSVTKYRQIVWQASWASVATHKVIVRVLGTSGRPRVDVDAFLKW